MRRAEVIKSKRIAAHTPDFRNVFFVVSWKVFPPVRTRQMVWREFVTKRACGSYRIREPSTAQYRFFSFLLARCDLNGRRSRGPVERTHAGRWRGRREWRARPGRDALLLLLLIGTTIVWERRWGVELVFWQSLRVHPVIFIGSFNFLDTYDAFSFLFLIIGGDFLITLFI